MVEKVNRIVNKILIIFVVFKKVDLYLINEVNLLKIGDKLLKILSVVGISILVSLFVLLGFFLKRNCYLK